MSDLNSPEKPRSEPSLEGSQPHSWSDVTLIEDITQKLLRTFSASRERSACTVCTVGQGNSSCEKKARAEMHGPARCGTFTPGASSSGGRVGDLEKRASLFKVASNVQKLLRTFSASRERSACTVCTVGQGNSSCEKKARAEMHGPARCGTFTPHPPVCPPGHQCERQRFTSSRGSTKIQRVCFPASTG